MTKTPIDKALRQNQHWAEETAQCRPGFFANLAKGQSPSLFWVGCCDSRVVPTEILKLTLGDLFIHTNVANQVRADDTTTMSALEYAIDHLKVDHVIVCGHTRCGGIQAAAASDNLEGRLGEWVQSIRDSLLTEENRAKEVNELCKLNVVGQVQTILQLGTLKRAWQTRQGPQVHGWLYRLEDGNIEQLCRHRAE